MKKITLPGFATISSNGQYHFDSGYPSNSRIVKPVHVKGMLDIHPNASIDFTPDPERIILPPVNTPVTYGDNYNVKRTSRNYIIQVKVPICETRRDTEKRLRTILTEAMRDITLDRME